MMSSGYDNNKHSPAQGFNTRKSAFHLAVVLAVFDFISPQSRVKKLLFCINKVRFAQLCI